MTGLYEEGKEGLGLGKFNFLNNDMVLVLLDSTYIPDLSNDRVQSDIPSSAVIYERSLTGVSFDKGIFDADDITFPSLLSDKDVAAFCIIKNSDSLSTSLLLYYCDNAPEFPITPDGTDFTIIFDNSINKIFKL